ncbi:MAG: hypothetical protein WCX95_02030 [Candidatus Gracilibacteria bacterium]
MNRNIEITTGEIDTQSQEKPQLETTCYLQYIPRVRAIIDKHGLLPLPESVVIRLAMLGIPNDQEESFLGHCETVGIMSSKLMQGLNRTTDIQFSTEEQVTIATGAHIHDIGKTGPAGDLNPYPWIFVKLFNINCPIGTREAHLRTLLDYGVNHGFLTKKEREYVKTVLREANLNPDTMTLRSFYDLHSLDTFDILMRAGVEESIAAIASGHHLKRDIKPNGYSIRDLVPTARIIELMDEAAAMTRKGNPKRGIPTSERISSIHDPFASMSRDHVIRDPYCEIIQVGIRSGILSQILEEHVDQNP